MKEILTSKVKKLSQRIKKIYMITSSMFPA
jgi:hypothetical protein